jgi:hypothetical protein
MDENENTVEAPRLGRVAYYLAIKHALLRQPTMSSEDSERLIRIENELRSLAQIEPPA